MEASSWSRTQRASNHKRDYRRAGINNLQHAVQIVELWLWLVRAPLNAFPLVGCSPAVIITLRDSHPGAADPHAAAARHSLCVCGAGPGGEKGQRVRVHTRALSQLVAPEPPEP